VHRRLNNLDRRLVAHVHRRVRRQRHLRQAERARVRIPRRPDDLEGGHHVEGHVEGGLAEAQVDVDEGACVALEPAGLDCYGAAFQGPFGAVLRGGHAAACSEVGSVRRMGRSGGFAGYAGGVIREV
jgi:hypothetical protein